MPLLDDLRQQKSALEALGARYGVHNIRVFGSVARREETPESDVDLLIHFDKKHYTGFDLGGFQYGASQLLGRRVDVVMDHCMVPALAPYILAEAEPL